MVVRKRRKILGSAGRVKIPAVRKFVPGESVVRVKPVTRINATRLFGTLPAKKTIPRSSPHLAPLDLAKLESVRSTLKRAGLWVDDRPFIDHVRDVRESLDQAAKRPVVRQRVDDAWERHLRLYRSVFNRLGNRVPRAKVAELGQLLSCVGEEGLAQLNISDVARRKLISAFLDARR